jgi:hypothetical protein
MQKIHQTTSGGFSAKRTGLVNQAALRRRLEVAGVEFIDENGGGPGVRLRKRGQRVPPK